MGPFTQADRALALLTTLAAVAGIVVLLLGDGTAATITGALLLGFAGIVGMALLFLLVGESEDRDRSRGL
jgi:formate hydrogenlyase subunit 3/multisubunit Na+/H+ antiporter MnhD subunit